MRRSLFILLFLLTSSSLFSQNFEVPRSVSFENTEDYTKQRDNVVKAINWLENTPIGQEANKRKDVNAFLMTWLTGSPDVTIAIDQNIVTFMDCSDCLMIFMGSWAKYALTNKDYDNSLKGTLYGIEGVINFYKKNKIALGKNKAIEKYVKLKNKEKLEDFIKSKI